MVIMLREGWEGGVGTLGLQNKRQTTFNVKSFLS